jgi:hypothetical protein
MKQRVLMFLQSIAIVISICRCKPILMVSDAQENSFQKIVAVENLNKYFQIYLDSANPKNLKMGDDIIIAFRNLTNQEVLFSVGFGIRLFIINDNKWVEIINDADYYGKGALLESSKSQQAILGGFVTSIRPALPLNFVEANPLLKLRIFVIGELMNNGQKTGIPVGAYLDVTLKQ